MTKTCLVLIAATHAACVPAMIGAAAGSAASGLPSKQEVEECRQIIADNPERSTTDLHVNYYNAPDVTNRCVQMLKQVARFKELVRETMQEQGVAVVTPPPAP